jgi:hypothetical protein
MMLGPLNAVGALGCVAVLFSQLSIQWRRTIAGDGAEQLSILIAVTSVLAFFPSPSSRAATVGALFVAAQVLLSYFTAGAVKLSSPLWRRDAILASILATHRFGSPSVAEALSDRRRLCLLLQWGVISLELCFPLALVLPRWAFIAFLGAGLAFHAACALLMGLNTFVWSFLATYPCLLYAWFRFSPFS